MDVANATTLLTLTATKMLTFPWMVHLTSPSRISELIVRRILSNKPLRELAERTINERKLSDWCIRHPSGKALRGAEHHAM
jgi:hypothetical protein